ncbi:RNA polymerase sigma factor [Streptomyces europaeiscabiei]|uniref:RNA polymerase sigma factor n=1 Tax=Streptomyces europaeiscabiei TaxID=146819 RepID=UPI0029AF1A1C|nr:sigma-70 family RNA polymerase sigma factor [Streptomyces europaeiscabiei]MDX3844955.1 sigma-70 family RNA polymerase sigma factor [Streptomyces europaeiscabiei]
MTRSEETEHGQAGRGDALPASPVGFEDFYRQTFPLMVATLQRRIHLDEATAEEVAQDTFATLLQKWELVRAAPNPTGYALVAARNRSIDLRRRFREVTLDLDAILEYMPDAEDAIAGVEQSVALEGLLVHLSPMQRQVFYLHFRFGLESREIADWLGVTPSTASVHLHHARKRLRVHLGP